MKAKLEKIEPGFGSSFTIRKFLRTKGRMVPDWHFHPEYEIVYISSGKGKRHIGDHISYFEDGDLIFLGPDLPHFGFTEESLEDHFEIVVQMKEEFLGKDFLLRPEMWAINQLFERSKQGLSFDNSIKLEIGRRLEAMLELNGFDRLITLLEILQTLARTEEYQLLNASGFTLEVNAQDFNRMQIILKYVEESFQQPIRLEDVAILVNMTVPAFCRYFKKLTQKTFTQYLNEYRIAHASRLLLNDHLSIASVSFESGFNNLSHFNKQFKQITGSSPRAYRKLHKKLVQ